MHMDGNYIHSVTHGVYANLRLLRKVEKHV